nr:MAG TPA: hypothetical protein [Caudoviricetes sp.]
MKPKWIKGGGDFPRNVLNSIGINNIILNTITIDLNPGTLTGYLLDDYNGEIYIFEENEVPGYVTENLDGPRTIHLYKIDIDELISVGYCASIDKAEQILVVLNNTFDKLGMDKKIKCLCVPVDHSKPYRLVEVFNLMTPDDIKITNVIHYDNIEDALNEKARIEYETSKYTGTDVNSYFVI